MNEIEALRSALVRERAARVEAERILEEKAAALHTANHELESAKAALERRVEVADASVVSSLRRLGLSLEASQAGAFEWEVGSGLVHADSRLCALLGCENTSGPVPFEDWLACLDAADGQQFSEALRAAARGASLDCSVRSANGSRAFAVHGRMLESSERESSVVFALFRDVTRSRAIEVDRRRLASHAARQERLVVLGELASMIAHEVNQPLTSIMNYASACVRLLGRVPESRDDLERALRAILDASEDASRIIRGVRGMITSPGEGFEWVGVGELFAAAISGTLTDSADAGVEVIGSPVAGEFRCNRVLLEHALLNLVRNAIEGLEDTVGAKIVRISFSESDQEVVIRVDDTGPGLGGLDPDEIFQPLVSGRLGGSGMGLALCRTVAEQHSGRLRCVGNPGHETGLRFEMIFPKEAGCFR